MLVCAYASDGCSAVACSQALSLMLLIAKLQSNLSSCFADCAEEYEQQVPKLRQQTLQQLRQSRQSAGY